MGIGRWAARVAEGQDMEYAEAFRTYGINRMVREFGDDEEQD